MSRLLEAIDAEIAAADVLIRACARQGAIHDAMTGSDPVVTILRRQFRSTSLTPNDMLATLRKIK